MYRLAATILVLLPLSLAALAAGEGSAKAGLEKAKADQGQWHWIPRKDMVCRDGSTTGFGVRLLHDAKAVMIYLQGGGACYDAKSCRQNTQAWFAGESFSRGEFERWAKTLGNQGLFNTADPKNPVARWHHIYVPYCTGDLHGGVRENAAIPGVRARQQFVGYRNVRNLLRIAAPYFRDAADFGLAGASAGGFGVLLNYPQVVRAFGGRSVAAFVDSAPIIPESSIKTSCFQRKLIDAFDLRLPAGCPECKDPSHGGLLNLYGHLSRNYPHGRFAFASADADLAGVILLNGESIACGGSSVNIFNYRSSLYALRDRYIGQDWATYLPSGLQHTMTQSDVLFLKRKFKGLSAGEWLSKINVDPPVHVPKARLRHE
jgi:hypothetical protein